MQVFTLSITREGVEALIRKAVADLLPGHAVKSIYGIYGSVYVRFETPGAAEPEAPSRVPEIAVETEAL